MLIERSHLHTKENTKYENLLHQQLVCMYDILRKFTFHLFFFFGVNLRRNPCEEDDINCL